MPDSTLDARIAEARKEADETYLRINTRVDFDNQEIIAHLVPEWLTAFATALLASERSARAEVEAEMEMAIRRQTELASAAEIRASQSEKERDEFRSTYQRDIKALNEQLAAAESRVKELEAKQCVECVRSIGTVGALRDQLTALRSQVASAKREGAREALTRLADVLKNGDGPFCVAGNAHRATAAEIWDWRDREYPAAPATPPERVSVTVQGVEFWYERGDPKPWRSTGRGWRSHNRLVDLCLGLHVTPTDDELRSLLALAGGAE